MGKKWSKEAKARNKERIAARKNGSAKPASRDAIIYLRHAQDAMTASLKAGRIKRFDQAHLLALLALSALQGQS